MNRAFLPTMMKSVFAALVAVSAISASAADAPAASASASASTAPAASAPTAAPAAPAAAAAPAAPDAGKGATLFANGDPSRNIPACKSCHGDGGNTTMAVTPKLAGQHAAYIVKQLNNFKTPDAAPDRNNPIMTPYAKSLTDEDIRNIAAYVSAQTIQPGAAKNKDTVELGKKIYRAGIKDKNVPACAACHGPAGAGIPAQFARIGSQNADYTTKELTDFASDARKNNAIMQTIASRMTPKEIAAVADYIAGLH